MGGIKPDHGDLSDRSLINSLLDLSESGLRNEFIDKITTVPNNWTEAVSPWKDVIPTPNYQKVLPPKKRRSQNKDGKGQSRKQLLSSVRLPSMEALAARNDDDLTNWDGQSDQKFFYKSVRCVDEDYITTGVVEAWKANVEPVTYRYVPNNGFYRKSKYPKTRDGVLHSRPVPLSWQQRKLQREIQRDLKRELNSQRLLQRTDMDKVLKKTETEEDGQLNRERSKSDATLKYNSTDNRLSPVLLPTLDDPLLANSVNEKFIESFTSRLSALEEEMKRDAKIFGKSREDEEAKCPLWRGRMKDSRISPPGGEALTHDTFCIKPIRSKQYLRPLEKVTPQQRMTEDFGKLAVAQLKYTTVCGETTTNLKMASIKKDVGNIHYRLSDHAGRNEMEDEETTLHSAFKTTKVVPNNKYSIKKLLGGKSTRREFSADSTSGLTNRVEKEYNSDRNPLSETVEGEFMSGISGKRVAVPLM